CANHALCAMPHAGLRPPHMHKFRFQDFEIWKDAIRIGGELDRIADALESRKKFRYAEQLRGAALSISNNIAEGSGSTSNKEFQQFLNYSRRSVFENANMVLFLITHGHLPAQGSEELLEALDRLSAKILNFSRSLGR
ncbi:four helix bundle protein, partial [Luteolibacter marinus]|uniref:four helix bundle protein n=1 Tax=Luteolibacter marinus TaxID=2776705 RepID=UPI001D026B0D